MSSDLLAAMTLGNELTIAKLLYQEKRELFIGLTLQFEDDVELWKKMDRRFSRGKGQSKKEFESVYCHDVGKGKPSFFPEQRMIYFLIAIASSVSGVNIPEPAGAGGETIFLERSHDQGSGFPQRGNWHPSRSVSVSYELFDNDTQPTAGVKFGLLSLGRRFTSLRPN